MEKSTNTLNLNFLSRLQGLQEAIIVELRQMDDHSLFFVRKLLRENNAELLRLKRTESTETNNRYIAVIWGAGDFVSLVRLVIQKCNEDAQKIRIIGGVFNSKSLTIDEVLSIAAWPNRREQLQLLIRQILSPGINITSQLTKVNYKDKSIQEISGNDDVGGFEKPSTEIKDTHFYERVDMLLNDHVKFADVNTTSGTVQLTHHSSTGDIVFQSGPKRGNKMLPVFWIGSNPRKNQEVKPFVESILNFMMSDLLDPTSLDGSGLSTGPLRLTRDDYIDTEWVIVSEDVQIHSIENVYVGRHIANQTTTSYATFKMRIPRGGDSEIRKLKFVPQKLHSIDISVVIYGDFKSYYRQYVNRKLIMMFDLTIPVNN